MSINQSITVNSFYFVNNGEAFRTFPKEISWNGRYITLRDGLRYLIGNGQGAGTKLFDMNGEDGQIYRLRQEQDNWTLLSTKGGN